MEKLIAYARCGWEKKAFYNCLKLKLLNIYAAFVRRQMFVCEWLFVYLDSFFRNFGVARGHLNVMSFNYGRLLVSESVYMNETFQN